MSTPDWIIKEQNEAVARCYIRQTGTAAMIEGRDKAWSHEEFNCEFIRQLTRIAASLQEIAEVAPDTKRLVQLLLAEKGVTL